MEKQTLIEKLLNDKVERNNQIDLSAYTLGLDDMYNALLQIMHQNETSQLDNDNNLVCKCPFCSTEMKGIKFIHYKCKNCNEYFTD